MFEVGGIYHIAGEIFEVLNIFPGIDPELVLFNSGADAIVYRNESDFMPLIWQTKTGRLFEN